MTIEIEIDETLWLDFETMAESLGLDHKEHLINMIRAWIKYEDDKHKYKNKSPLDDSD